MLTGQRVTRNNRDGVWIIHRVRLSNKQVDLCRVDAEGWAFGVGVDTLTLIPDS